MNKIILAISLLMFLGAENANAQQRLVLYEEFTGPCPESAVEDPVLDALMKSGSNPSHICMIKNYLSGGDALYMMTINNDTTRSRYYSNTYIPCGRMDGMITHPSAFEPGLPRDLTQADIDAATAIPSPFNMSVSSQLNTIGDSITITVKVKAVAAYAPVEGLIRLRTARCKSINFTPAWTNGNSKIVNSVRNMYPNADGIPISSEWAVGDSQTYVLKGPVLAETNWLNTILALDSFTVAWIQNDNDKKIAQAAKEGLIMDNPNSLSSVTGNSGMITKMSITPNPTKEIAIISVETSDEATVNIEIFDISGSSVCVSANHRCHKGDNAIPIPIDLPTGVYIVKMETDKGEQYQQRLSIIR